MERQIATREITAKIEKTFFSFSRPWLWACFLNGPNAAALVAPTLIRHWLTGTARIVCAAGVYATVGSPSVCLSVRLSHCSSGGEAVTQCGQCHVHTVGTRLTTDRPSVVLRNMYGTEPRCPDGSHSPVRPSLRHRQTLYDSNTKSGINVSYMARTETSYRPGCGETICSPPAPMAVRLAADLRPPADGSAVRTWLSCRQQAFL